MKKIYLTFLIVAGSIGAFAQGKFSAAFTNTGNVLTFKIQPDITTTTGFSGIEFFIRYATSTPAFTYGAVTVNTTAFPGMQGNGLVGGGAPNSGQWEIIHNDPNVAATPGFNVDHFLYTAPATITTAASYTGGTPYDVISVQLVGDPTEQGDFQFVSDDTYGTSYLALTDQNGGDLLPASLNNYFFPSTLSTPGPNGATIYYQELLNVPLPVRFLNFTATKNDNTAVLNWAVENESALTETYIVEKSLNGVSFSPFTTIAALNNGRSSNTYTSLVENLSGIRNSGVIYFRIKQVDKDGNFAYAPIRSIRLNAKALVVGVYPNPVKNTANVSFDLAENTDVIISVIDGSGKQVITKQVQAFKGSNINKLNMAALASGNYTLKVQAGSEVKVVPVVKVDQ